MATYKHEEEDVQLYAFSIRSRVWNQNKTSQCRETYHCCFLSKGKQYMHKRDKIKIIFDFIK